ncbi:hypothetical protein CP8484711_1329A, partial [Chlamydia psittaci 84-8471/1]
MWYRCNIGIKSRITSEDIFAKRSFFSCDFENFCS